MPFGEPLSKRFLRELVPTFGQAFGSLILAVLLLVATQMQEILRVLGITQAAVEETKNEFGISFADVLHSQILANVAQLAFWAIVGLVAYIICWTVYNLLIEAGNEVKLTVGYTNRGRWHFLWKPVAIKFGALLCLILVALSCRPGVSLWVTLANQALVSPSPARIAAGLLAPIGFAAQIYVVLFFILLTLTPWYRSDAFTQTQG